MRIGESDVAAERAGVLMFLDTFLLAAGRVPALISNAGLKVLLNARLIQRRRSGRSVLYTRTAAGDTLITVSHGLAVAR